LKNFEGTFPENSRNCWKFLAPTTQGWKLYP